MTRRPWPGALATAVLGLALGLPACSVRQVAVRSLGNALAEGGATFASDDDPELVRDAAPFSLKTMEALIEEAPRHQGLLLAAAAGFTQYAYGFLQLDADYAEGTDLHKAEELRTRAVKLYLRARDYGLRGLEVKRPGFRERLRTDRESALRSLKKEQVPLLYWTGLAWAGAMALRKSDSSLTADQDLAEALMQRALVLDESYELGSIHDFFISYEAGRASVGGSRARAREHFERAVTLAGGRRAWPFLNFAESASVAAQDREEFERLIREALAVDPDREKGQRLSNLLAQKRARWLLARGDELFVE